VVKRIPMTKNADAVAAVDDMQIALGKTLRLLAPFWEKNMMTSNRCRQVQTDLPVL
jgi:hypothetical protein